MQDNELYVKLIEIVKANKSLQRVFGALDEMGITEYYIGAGAIVQSVWNLLTDRPEDYGISDVDIVFFDDKNLDAQYEAVLSVQLNEKLDDFPLWLDIKNQARVHLWYKEKFGIELEAYASLESAIDTWPTTSTALGIRRQSESVWQLYAPFGVQDVFDLKIRANNRLITEAIYLNKVNKWQNKWAELQVVEWDDHEVPYVNQEPIQIRG
ncbi:nucleotidyltransferase family protein [Fusibacter sp. 3D3]|uniref:nucleotidyltransferase family protein n=1 Tax=Fusibacter sp. 3D3 TaxID=1048380 RepID=UPI000853BFBB|nr:nucleotidyltransferase family protein [Fusibacter sp. 3D3]GAU76225.1 Mll5052 protein [Fusibacter sp. 3D3]